MSVAILVLSCYHPKSLAVALDYYYSADASVYVHVDLKRDLQSYKSALPQPHPDFTKTRHSIYWGGFCMVRAEMELIRLALNSPKNHDRFVLVSDDTLPIVTKEQFHRVLSGPYEQAWMINKDRSEDYSQRYREFYFFDSPATCPCVEDIRETYFGRSTLDKIQQMSLLMRKGKSPIVPYHGSQWWGLSREAAQLVLNTHDNDLRFRESFEFTAIPDEMFIQSALGNGGFLDKIRNSPIHVEWYERRPRLYVQPADLPDTVGGDVALIRKVDSESSQLLAFFQSKWSSGEPVIPS